MPHIDINSVNDHLVLLKKFHENCDECLAYYNTLRVLSLSSILVMAIGVWTLPLMPLAIIVYIVSNDQYNIVLRRIDSYDQTLYNCIGKLNYLESQRVQADYYAAKALELSVSVKDPFIPYEEKRILLIELEHLYAMYNIISQVPPYYRWERLTPWEIRRYGLTMQ